MKNDRPDRLIAALGTELDLTAEDIADILWLTHIQQQQVEKSPSTFKVYFGDILVNNLGFLIFLLALNFLFSILFCYQLLLSNLAMNKILMKAKSNVGLASINTLPIQTTTKTTNQSPQIGLVTRKSQQKIIKSPEEEIDKPIKVPNAPSIRQPLPLIKALRPLLRSVPSRINLTLNEIATANKIAEERIWQLITQPTLEPWLELALVVDESSSMLIWHRTVWELKKLFNHYGAFRDVRTWSLVVDKQHLGILPKMGMVSKRTMIRSPQELIDPNNRRLILIASDCLSSIWQDKTILSVLENWANNAPVAILQMLPERMWSRTALGQVSSVELYGLAPGVINKDLLVTRSFLWNDENEKQKQSIVKIPVFSLEPEVASTWSSMVSGRGSISSAGFLFTSELVSTPQFSSANSSLLKQFTPKDLVNQFLGSATPIARRLTTLLAASPVISLPVVRLIQETMLPQSEQFHVAEVLCGGLFVPKSSPNINAHPDEVEYRFIDEEIRSVLLNSAPVTDTVRILSKYIYRKFNRSLDDFIAGWRVWSQSEDSTLAEKFRPFAVVTAEVLRRKGRQYLDFVREVEAHYGLVSIDSSQFTQKISLFSEDTGETLRAKIIDNYAPKTLLDIDQASNLVFEIDSKNTKIFCVYTNYSIQLSSSEYPRRDALKKGISRETVFPESKASQKVRADLHNIILVRVRINSFRSNLPFAEIPDDEVTVWFRQGKEINSPPREQIGEYSKLASDGFEPRNDAKGKIARAMFYVDTFYREQVDREYFEQQKDTLRKWHREYPPTEAEIERSRKVANSAQGNHNPFVLDPTLVERIFFTLKTWTFDVATIFIDETETPPGIDYLEPFEFEVAFIEINQSAQISTDNPLEILDEEIFTKTGKNLNDVEQLVLQGTLANQTYEQIAASASYSVRHLKNAGIKLWEVLSEVLGGKVTKRNLQSVLKQWTPRRHLTIHRHRQQSQYFIEDLGNGVQLEMVAIREGSFLMGSPADELERLDSESPQHTVTIKPFFFGKYPVTQAQWQAVAAMPQVNRELDPNPSKFKGANRPVERVTWYDAVEFCDRLTAHTKRQYRLPSEAEWEYACRAGTTTPFHFGETITSELANYDANYTYGAGVEGTYREETTEVGIFGVANNFGLYDMHGNVWEWCLDDWHSNYEGAPTNGSAWFDNDNENLYQKQGKAMLRGGSWDDNPEDCRSASRFNFDWAGRDYILDIFGFRVVCAFGRTIQ